MTLTAALNTTRIPVDFEPVGTAVSGRWLVFIHAYSQTALLWEIAACIWLNPEDEGEDFTRWHIDELGRLFDVESRKTFEITDLIAEAA